MSYENLTTAETRLVDAVCAGLPCVLAAPGSPLSDIRTWPSWGDERIVRAEILIALLTNKNPAWLVHARGVRLSGARIVGDFSIEGARLSFGVTLENCVLDGPFILADATTKSICLNGSSVPGIVADRCTIDGALFMQRGFVCMGEVNLKLARVSGTVECDGGAFINPFGATINLDSGTLGGSLFLRDGFLSTGKIRLHGAKIGGDVVLSGQMSNPGGIALGADQINILGSLSAERLCVRGSMRFPRAHISGNVELVVFKIEFATLPAISFGNAEIFGAFAAIDFYIVGGVEFNGVSVHGNLGWTFGEIHLPSSTSFLFHGASIDSCLILLGVQFSGEGTVVLSHSSARFFGDDDASWPSEGRLILDGFVYEQFAGNAPTSWRSRLRWLRLQKREHLYAEFRAQPFEQLSSALRRMGHEIDARAIAIEKQVARRESGTLDLANLAWNWIFGFILGYGYRPFRAVIISCVIVFVGTLLFFDADKRGEMIPTKNLPSWSGVSLSNRALPPEYPKFNPAIYSLDTFLPVISLRQEENWVPRNDANISWLLWSYVWFLIASGWLLTTLFIASLTGLIKRD